MAFVEVVTTLDAALRTAGIPIEGVSIGIPMDRTTWTVQFLPAATGPQRAQAASIVATFDPANPATITAYQLAQAQLTSRQKDILATVAREVRSRNVTAWNAMTTPEKKAAVLAEANVWRDLRVFIENNL